MSSFRWCKIHRRGYYGNCIECHPIEKIIIKEKVFVFEKRTPDYSNIPSLEEIMLIQKMDWTEKQWTAWRIWNALKNI